MWISLFRICGALGVTLLSGTYYFILLRGTCVDTPMAECISKGPRSPTEMMMKPLEQTKRSGAKVAAADKVAKAVEPAKAPPPPAGLAVKWPQTRSNEELLIWNANLDGEVGRIAPADFHKAVRDQQATLPPGISTEEQQIATLRKRVDGIRSRWGFEKEDDTNAAELWLPRKLLGSGQSLAYGTQYQSSTGDFVVDVAERVAAEGMFERIRQNHCCKPPREPEGAIVDTSDAAGPGFMLNAHEGRLRVSVRAQQRDGVIRILAIAYDATAKEREYRVLRNAIASSYAAFGPARKERVYDSCQRSDGERCGADKSPSQPAQWDNNKQGPL